MDLNNVMAYLQKREATLFMRQHMEMITFMKAHKFFNTRIPTLEALE